MRLAIRQTAGVILLPVAICLLAVVWCGEMAARLYDILREGLDEMLGEP